MKSRGFLKKKPEDFAKKTETETLLDYRQIFGPAKQPTRCHVTVQTECSMPSREGAVTPEHAPHSHSTREHIGVHSVALVSTQRPRPLSHAAAAAFAAGGAGSSHGKEFRSRADTIEWSPRRERAAAKIQPKHSRADFVPGGGECSRTRDTMFAVEQ